MSNQFSLACHRSIVGLDQVWAFLGQFLLFSKDSRNKLYLSQRRNRTRILSVEWIERLPFGNYRGKLYGSESQNRFLFKRSSRHSHEYDGRSSFVG